MLPRRWHLTEHRRHLDMAVIVPMIAFGLARSVASQALHAGIGAVGGIVNSRNCIPFQELKRREESLSSISKLRNC
jgi:hypothetical protein